MAAADLRRARRIRGSALGLLIVLALLGVTGLLGGHTGIASASANGYELRVEYPRIFRAGLPADGSIRMTRREGFSQDVTVAITKEYLELFDVRAMLPAPTSQTSAPPYVYFTFETPPGSRLEVSFTASGAGTLDRVGVRHAEIVVLVGGAPVVRTSYRTWVVP
ncbi:MAG: hypothetical protein ACRDS9_03365 [Pseudonocardiaceae bacterium]